MINLFFFIFSKNQKKTYQNFRFFITHFLVLSSSKIWVRKKTTRIQISYIPKCEFGCVYSKLGARVDIWKSIVIDLEILSRISDQFVFFYFFKKSKKNVSKFQIFYYSLFGFIFFKNLSPEENNSNSNILHTKMWIWMCVFKIGCASWHLKINCHRFGNIK